MVLAKTKIISIMKGENKYYQTLPGATRGKTAAKKTILAYWGVPDRGLLDRSRILDTIISTAVNLFKQKDSWMDIVTHIQCAKSIRSVEPNSLYPGRTYTSFRINLTGHAMDGVTVINAFVTGQFISLCLASGTIVLVMFPLKTTTFLFSAVIQGSAGDDTLHSYDFKKADWNRLVGVRSPGLDHNPTGHSNPDIILHPLYRIWRDSFFRNSSA